MIELRQSSVEVFAVQIFGTRYEKRCRFEIHSFVSCFCVFNETCSFLVINRSVKILNEASDARLLLSFATKNNEFHKLFDLSRRFS